MSFRNGSLSKTEFASENESHQLLDRQDVVELSPINRNRSTNDETLPLANPDKFGDVYYPKQDPSLRAVKLNPSWEEANIDGGSFQDTDGHWAPRDSGRTLKEPLKNAPLADIDELRAYDAIGNPSYIESPPLDRRNIIYFTFILHGIGTLLPWNMFITAKDYFVDYKLSENYTGQNLEFTTNFLPYLGFASQFPNLILNWINVFIPLKGDMTKRIIISLVIIVFLFIVTILFAMVDSSSWPVEFFWVTMVSAGLLNMANGVFQNTLYGLAAKFPFKYTGAVVLGSNISGTFTSIISIISIALSPNARTAAIYYFITALFVLLICVDTFFALPLNAFYRFYNQVNETKKGSTAANKTPYFYIFKKALPQLVNVFCIFFTSLTVFPSVLADIRQIDADFFISPKYYTAVCCFLCFNMFAMIGNIFPSFFVWPSAKWLWIPTWLRIVFIPYFVLCNFQPAKVDRIMPVLLGNDYAFLVASILLGLTHGYYSSLAMMYTPRTVEPQHAAVAGMFAVATLILGIISGINFSLLLTYLVTNVTW